MSEPLSYVLVDPRFQLVQVLSLPDLDLAKRLLDLKGVDHGMFSRTIGYCVDEFGLFAPVKRQSYFTVTGRPLLFAGPAVFYGVGFDGATINLVKLPEVRWLPTADDVEAGIEAHTVERPFMAINGHVIWQWPDPSPEEFVS